MTSLEGVISSVVTGNNGETLYVIVTSVNATDTSKTDVFIAHRKTNNLQGLSLGDIVAYELYLYEERASIKNIQKTGEDARVKTAIESISSMPVVEQMSIPAFIAKMLTTGFNMESKDEIQHYFGYRGAEFLGTSKSKKEIYYINKHS